MRHRNRPCFYAGVIYLPVAMQLTEPATPQSKAQAIEDCSDFGRLSQTHAASQLGPSSNSSRASQSDTLRIHSSQAMEIFPGVLVADVVQSDSKMGGEPARFACLSHSQSDAGDFVIDAVADEIPLMWPDDPYSEEFDAALSTEKALGIYDVFIAFGANTMFTAVGIFIAVIFCSCYSCQSLNGVYQAACMLGLVETVMNMIPGFGFFVSLPMDVVAIGLASRFVKDFHVDWRDGYRPLARGAMTIMFTRWLLSLLLYGLITHLVFVTA